MNKCYYIPRINDSEHNNNSDQKSLIYGAFLVFFYRLKYNARAPPCFNRMLIKNPIGGMKVKKFFKQLFQRCENLIPLPCIIENKEGGQGCER